MSDFFTVFTLTPWDNLRTEKLTQIRVLSLKNLFKTYPVIEPIFFDDLSSNVNNNPQYSWIQSIKRIVGPSNNDYDIQNWNFLWAFDVHNRMFQFLFQKEGEQGILVGLAPPELAKLFSEHGKDALLRTLSLLNTPLQIKFLMILAPKGKSIAQERQLFDLRTNQYDRMKFIETLKRAPNVNGSWFLHNAPRCPICGESMVELSGYTVAFGKLICPRCGFSKK